MKIIKKVYNWVTNKRMDKVNSIENILRELNSGVDKNWVAAPGIAALTSVTVSEAETSIGNNPQVTFNASRGVIVKIFINKKTGETKTYLAKALSDDPEGKLIR
jgi:hypothetical protein